MSEYCKFFTRQKLRCYPLEIIDKDEKPTGKFICLCCHKPVEIAGIVKNMEDIIKEATRRSE